MGAPTPRDLGGTLSDLQMRVTLLERRAQGGAGVPAGAITVFAGPTAPAGWLLCNGAAVSRANYPTLFSVIGTTYGAGDGSTTFNVPNVSHATMRNIVKV